jgi:hypothetical protein
MQWIGTIAGLKTWTEHQHQTKFGLAKRKFDKKIAEQNLKDMIHVFESCKVTTWLHAGTLLGCIRDGDFISHDYDTDVAAFQRDYKNIGLAVGILIRDYGFELIRCPENNTYFSIIRNEVYIDIYLYIEKVKGWFSVYGDWIHQKDLKFKRMTFLSMEVNVSINSENILEDWYGSDWRIPIRGKSAKAKDRRLK